MAFAQCVRLILDRMGDDGEAAARTMPGKFLIGSRLAELHTRKRLAHGDFQIIGINRPQQPADQAPS